MAYSELFSRNKKPSEEGYNITNYGLLLFFTTA